MSGSRFIVRGQVQGVGFRPAVWRLAREMGLAGDVRNTGRRGSRSGSGAGRAGFSPTGCGRALPVLARIDAVEAAPLDAPAPGRASRSWPRWPGGMRAAVTPDAATCPQCLAEIRDPSARRYRYPFANCTDCGPRFSIVRAGPYDRARTTMADFAMCPDCAAEYRDPADRRFHAQPIACPACGPRVWLEKLEGGGWRRRFAVTDAADAVRGLILRGPYRRDPGAGRRPPCLRCDQCRGGVPAARAQAPEGEALRPDGARPGGDPGTMPRCRRRKRRCWPSAAAPIVLLRRAGRALPEAVAPGLDRLGVHAALHAAAPPDLRGARPAAGDDLGQPVGPAAGDAKTRRCGSGLRRWRISRCCTTGTSPTGSTIRVMRVDLGRPRVLRRARGLAPRPLALPEGFGRARARCWPWGRELKNTFCLVRGRPGRRQPAYGRPRGCRHGRGRSPEPGALPRPVRAPRRR